MRRRNWNADGNETQRKPEEKKKETKDVEQEISNDVAVTIRKRSMEVG